MGLCYEMNTWKQHFENTIEALPVLVLRVTSDRKLKSGALTTAKYGPRANYLELDTRIPYVFMFTKNKRATQMSSVFWRFILFFVCHALSLLVCLFFLVFSC